MSSVTLLWSELPPLSFALLRSAGAERARRGAWARLCAERSLDEALELPCDDRSEAERALGRSELCELGANEDSELRSGCRSCKAFRRAMRASERRTLSGGDEDEEDDEDDEDD